MLAAAVKKRVLDIQGKGSTAGLRQGKLWLAGSLHIVIKVASMMWVFYPLIPVGLSFLAQFSC